MIDLTHELEKVSTVAITGHIRPDGDCVGSCMGLYLYLKEYYPHIQAKVYLEKFSDSFCFIKDIQEVCEQCDDDVNYDVIFCLDSGDMGRLGNFLKYLKSAKKSICIDHHISNTNYGDENYIVPDASSTSELVYNLLDHQKITKEVAEALYMGIAHDTGIFQYSCTSSYTMRIAGELMDKGIDFSKIITETYYQKTYIQNQILGRALLESILVLNGKCIISVIKKRELEFYGVSPVDLDGIISQLRNTSGIEVAIFIYESDTQEYKVSMRSNRIVDVRKIAEYFGGGGHIRAAGCSMQGCVHDVINNLTPQIEKQLLQEMK